MRTSKRAVIVHIRRCVWLKGRDGLANLVQKRGSTLMVVLAASGASISVQLIVSTRSMTLIMRGMGPTGCTICEKECPWNTITMVSGVEVEELLSEEVTEGV
jgi:ferredoxin